MASACETDGPVHSNALTVMKCMIAMLSVNYEQLEEELNSAMVNRLVTESDQILINYFEMMRISREVEQNYQTEGVFEEFTLYVNSMIDSSKDPTLKGFFYFLKAMAQTAISEEGEQKLSR